jgi:hypothetical protein
MGQPLSKSLNCDAIRKLFADGRYSERFQQGEFEYAIHRRKPPRTRPGEQFAPGYQRQMVIYRQGGRTIAHVHQRAGDKFGNPAPRVWNDPKYVLQDGVRYRFDTSVCRNQPCECELERLRRR